MHVSRNVEACSCNHHCSGKAIIITHCECVCPACNAHATYLRPDPLFCSSALSHKRHDFWNEVTEHKMCVLFFSTTFVWSISHSKKKSARYDQKCLVVFIYSNRHACTVLKKLAFSRQFFRKTIKYKIWWKSVLLEPSCSIGQTDGHDVVNSRFSQFCECA
jgi:hypothetical protein